MMPSFDCFVARTTSELTLIVTGAAEPPVITDEDDERQVTLRPAVIDRLGWLSTTIRDNGSRPTGTWWGELGYDPAHGRARLRAEVDGVTYRMSVATPEPLPPPKPARRRGRKADRHA